VSEAGMDDHSLSEWRKWFKQRCQPEGGGKEVSVEESTFTPLNAKVLQTFRATAGENASAFLAELIDCYLTPKQVAIATALKVMRMPRQAAHILKSSSAALAAKPRQSLQRTRSNEFYSGN